MTTKPTLWQRYTANHLLRSAVAVARPRLDAALALDGRVPLDLAPGICRLDPVMADAAVARLLADGAYLQVCTAGVDGPALVRRVAYLDRGRRRAR